MFKALSSLANRPFVSQEGPQPGPKPVLHQKLAPIVRRDRSIMEKGGPCAWVTCVCAAAKVRRGAVGEKFFASLQVEMTRVLVSQVFLSFAAAHIA